MVTANVWMQTLFIIGVVLVGSGLFMILFGVCDLIFNSLKSEGENA